jgi:hypothetical protein
VLACVPTIVDVGTAIPVALLDSEYAATLVKQTVEESACRGRVDTALRG